MHPTRSMAHSRRERGSGAVERNVKKVVLSGAFKGSVLLLRTKREE
jgi:hypothetical protein